MIPLKLQIKNFLSYGSELQEIDFQPYNLICLSGKNGHGKSSLLDAMTWAIWGEARKTTGTGKADHGLLRLGQRHMIVIFDFEVNKSKYRVRREFTFAYGKPYALLEFGMFEHNEKLIALTDKTIRATQDKIESMINLNYDSFCNSAFLRQGSSNEFSKKSPKDRKEILANILGLNKYENLRKSAFEKVRQQLIEKDGILKVQEHIEKEFSTSDEILSNLILINSEIKNISDLEVAFVNEKNELEIKKKNFLNKLNEFQLIELQLKNLKEEKDKKVELLLSLYSKWKNFHLKLINFPEEKVLKEKKLNLIEIISEFQSKFEKKLELKELYLKQKEHEQKLFNILNNQKNLLIQEKKIEIERINANNLNLNEKIKLIDKNIIECLKEAEDIKKEIESFEINIKKLDENYFEKIEKQFEKRKNFYQQLIAKGNLLKSELITLQQKQKLSVDEQNPSCPLCEQNLSASRKKFLKSQFTKQEKFLNHRLKRISKIIQKLKEILLVQHQEIDNLKKVIENNKLNQIKLIDSKKNQEKINFQMKSLNLNKNELIKNLQDSTELISEKNGQLLEIQNKNLIDDPEYDKISSILKELEVKLNDILYDPEEHKKANEKLKDIEQNFAIFENKSEFIQERDKIKNEIYQFFESIKKIKLNLKKLDQKSLDFSFLKNEEQELDDKEQKLLHSMNELIKKKENLFQQKGSFESRKLKIEQLAEQHKNQKKLISEIDESIEDFKAISIALSKDGIQALLIEDAIPEIENECNDLLSRLTDNQSQILIESLRDLKKGGTKETLDIKISDGAGIRPYEMFSGGEAFRIDFALRIAISKLLARRAGTSLQTLIIDEGFGSQDEEGLSNIMESIYKIQNDFAKIIIVSHLNSMKDQFPVHFFVEKGPAGSKVKVLEQG